MCAIAGVVAATGVQGSIANLKKAVGAVAHRGPQAQAYWVNPGQTAALGHARLCVIDVTAAGAQPMHYAGRYTVVYNGEIYNYIELKQELQQGGHVFSSGSDTEVLLAAFAHWGPDCLQRLEGAFAFAIWDEAEQVLFAARDRMGEKPFFFFYDDEQLWFASEIKAFWQLGLRKNVNPHLLYNFITLGYTGNPTDGFETFFQGVQKLPAAHSLTFRPHKKELQTAPYWQIYPTEKTLSEAEAIETFTSLFSSSIRQQLRSDVAIGTSLSGGLDSSAIVAFCSGGASAQYSHKCFTASFPGYVNDETVAAGKVAGRYGLQQLLATVTDTEVAALMDKVVAVQDEPFSSASVLAQYAVFSLAKASGITVLLDGQGADELLGGYHKYYKWRWQELYRHRQLTASGELAAARSLGINEPFTLANKAAALLPDFTAALRQTQQSRNAQRHPHLTTDFAAANKQQSYYTLPTQPTLNGALYYNSFVNGLEELLRLADRNSMAHSVEVRLPFLNHKLVEFLFTLPPHLKIQQGYTKWLLRKAVDGQLPPEIVWRKDKIGYEPPQKTWMQHQAVQERIRWAQGVLVDQGILQKGILQSAITPVEAHQPDSFNWRYWSAAALFS